MFTWHKLLCYLYPYNFELKQISNFREEPNCYFPDFAISPGLLKNVIEHINMFSNRTFGN